jgi:hypothetical protein
MSSRTCSALRGKSGGMSYPLVLDIPSLMQPSPSAFSHDHLLYRYLIPTSGFIIPSLPSKISSFSFGCANDQIVLESKQEESHEKWDHTWRWWISFCTESGLQADAYLSPLPEPEQALIIRAFLALYQVAQWHQSGNLLGKRSRLMVSSTARDAAGHLAALFQSHFKQSQSHFTSKGAPSYSPPSGPMPTLLPEGCIGSNVPGALFKATYRSVDMWRI